MSRHWIDRGTCRQNFKIRVDISPLIEEMTENVLSIAQADAIDEIELDESYVDGDELVIVGTYDTPYMWEHYDATLYDPPENDIERGYIDDLEPFIPANVKKYIKSIKVEESDDDCEYKSPEYSDPRY